MTADTKSRPTRPPRPEPRRISLDRMPSIVEGEVRYYHEGEWLEVTPLVTTRTTRITLELMAREFGPKFDDRKITEAEDDEERVSGIKELLGIRQANVVMLSQLVVRWNVTRVMDGKALPDPADNPEAFDDLASEEVQFLSYAVLRAIQRPAKDDDDGNGDDEARDETGEEAADKDEDEKARRD